MSAIPLSVPHLVGNEWAYLKECLDTGWISSVGPFVDRFEREFAARIGSKAAIATVNGTAALHTALLVAGVQPDDEVLVSTFTFMAPVNTIRYCGAWPVLVDCESDFWQIDPQLLSDFIAGNCTWESGALYNKASRRRIRALLVVDLYGHPVDMDPILEVARKYNLAVVEDASESLGAEYKGLPVGRKGDIACFSFNGNKLITTGGGGMITTDNPSWAERARYLTTQAKDDPVEYIHHDIGYNYRLTNIQAAIGVAQLEQLDAFLDRKQAIFARYQQLLEGVPGITLFRGASWARCTQWLINILVDDCGGRSSRDLLRFLQERKMQTRPLWRPVHLQTPYQGAEAVGGGVAEALYERGLSLPCSVGLENAQVDAIAAAVKAWADASVPTP